MGPHHVCFGCDIRGLHGEEGERLQRLRLIFRGNYRCIVDHCKRAARVTLKRL